jgi:hypothetical protein
MIKKNLLHEESNLVLVPVQMLNEIKHLIQEIKSQNALHSEKPDVLGEFISEKDAQKLLGRRTTWFYEQRRSGKLPFSKVGSKVFYRTRDIHTLITTNNGKG